MVWIKRCRVFKASGFKSFMKDIASGRLLPEVNFWTTSSTCKEVAIRREGHPFTVPSHSIQEKFRMLSIPYKETTSISESKPRGDRKEEGHKWDRVLGDKQGLDLCR